MPSQKEVTAWLVESDDSAVSSVLATVATRRPLLFAKSAGIAQDHHRHFHAEESCHTADFPPELLPTTPSGQLTIEQEDKLREDRTAIQFGSHMYYAEEDEGKVVVEVLRIGDTSRHSAVNWRTKDGSALAGVNFLADSGRCVFEPGEHEYPIEVTLLPNSRWENTPEFSIQLDAGSADNATISLVMGSARVKIIDDDCFPNNDYLQVEDDDLESVPASRLWRDLFLFNWGVKLIRVRLMKCVLVGVFENFNFILQLILQIYLVDFVLDTAELKRCPFAPNNQAPECGNDGKHIEDLYWIVLGQILPFGILHFLNYRMVTTFALGGPSRALLQMGIFRRFLDASSECRLRMSGATLMQVITRDVEEVVHKGYTVLVTLFKLYCQLALMVLFQTLTPFMFPHTGDPGPQTLLGLMPVIVLPTLMAIFMQFRSPKLKQKRVIGHEDMERVIQVATDTFAHFPLIANYMKRPMAADKFAARIKAYNTSFWKGKSVLLNNIYFARWLAIMLVGTWTVFGGSRVITNGGSLGMFLSNVRVFTKFGDCCVTIYNFTTELQSAVPALIRVIKHMNMETDLSTRRDLHAALAYQSRMWKARAINGTEGPGFAVDSIPILVGNLSFTYMTKGPDQQVARTQNVNFKGLLELQQGTLTCLAGSKGSGKATLLKIISGEMQPTPTQLGWSDRGYSKFRDTSQRKGADPHDIIASMMKGSESRLNIPSHLRVLSVKAPLFVEGTLKHNLLFGLADDSPLAEDERVRNICSRLGLEDEILKHIDEHHAWEHVLSQTQSVIVNLARALISDPHVLCLHKPTLVFEPVARKEILSVLRDFVDNRGVEQCATYKPLRRPRTCIMSISTMQDMSISDKNFFISPERGIEELDKYQVKAKLTQDMHAVDGSVDLKEIGWQGSATAAQKLEDSCPQDLPMEDAFIQELCEEVVVMSNDIFSI